MEPASSGDFLVIGKVIRPHGLEGLLRVWLYAKSESSLLDMKTVLLRSASGNVCELPLIGVKSHKNVFLMELGLINSKNEAEKYRGAEVIVKNEDLTCEEDEFFWQELLGIKVYLDTGEYLGTVFQIIYAGSNDIYMIKDGSREIYIPATYDVVKEVDLKNKKMIISPMEGLLDINEV